MEAVLHSDLQVNQLSGTFPDVAGLPRLQYLGLNGNSDLSGPFPTGKAPPNLVTCHVDTLLASSCPAQNVLDDPESLAAKCSISCRGGGKPSNATDNAANAEDSTQDEDSTSQNATTAKSRTDSLDQQAQTPASLAESLSSGQTQRLSSSVALIAGMISLFTLF